MIAVLENVRVMEKDIKLDKEGKQIYIFNCYQKGEKSLIPVKNVSEDLYLKVNEEDKISIKVNLMAWGQNGNYGLAVRFVDVVSLHKK